MDDDDDLFDPEEHYSTSSDAFSPEAEEEITPYDIDDSDADDQVAQSESSSVATPVEVAQAHTDPDPILLDQDGGEQDRGLFLCLAAVLIGFGTLMVHSASITSWPTEYERVYLSRHVTLIAVGVVGAVLCAALPVRVWIRLAPWAFTGTFCLLGAVLIPGVGTTINGARRWFRFGPFSFQPSELAKITVPLLLCHALTKCRADSPRGFAKTVRVLFPSVLALPLILFEPDLGTALFVTLGMVVALLVGGWPLRNFAIAASCLLPLAAFGLTLKPYQVRRITGFLAVWRNLDDAPYQLKQSLLTMGAGGLSGVGLGRGLQKLSYLPEANTDFVFAVVGEELGLVGTLGLVAMWLALFFTGLRLLNRLPRHSFGFCFGFTLLTQLVLQAALNMAVVTALVPPKGIPHPLLSYGGSNLVVSITSLGIIVGLTRQAEKRDTPRVPVSSDVS